MQTQGVVPMLSYENGIAALEWLARVFGFQENMRMLDENNERLTHGEMETGNGIIMLATPTPDYESPKKHRAHCEQARKWHQVPWVIDGVLVYVGNIDAHYHRAKNAGAVILSGIEDGFPARRYRAEDLEGHRWMFMQKENKS
jgi:PhnB protein